MGIRITKSEDPDLYESTRLEAQRILTISEEIRVTVQKIFASNQDKTSYKNTQQNFQPGKIVDMQPGFCIRTGVSIPFNLDRPLSIEAFKKWNEFADHNYREKYCHFSGELSNGETTMSRPILAKYWKKASKTYGF
jgi:hypothetical protein